MRSGRERPLRVLELFCGIGGCAAALGPDAGVVAAVDQNRQALRAYSANFPHPVYPLAIESISDRQWRAWDTDMWWMSPPCRPFTTRGLRRDLDDPRSRGFVAVLERIAELRPRYVAFENVPGFAGSRAHARMHAVLADAGYAVRETELCPTELGSPNRRRRYYLVAGLGPVGEWPPRSGTPVHLADVLDASPEADLWCPDDLPARYPGALNVVDASNSTACAACFTSAYGRSVVRSGSYLATASGLRRFSASEILRLLDFPAWYRLPSGLTRTQAWSLAGNSVSVRAVRWVLATFAG